MARMRADGVTLLPLYTTEEGGTVSINSDTWPGTGGVLGLTKAGIEEAKKNNVKPAGGGGFAYIRGPDDALIEVQGDMPAERFNHVHMYHEDPFCAQLWYQKHLNAPVPQGRRGAPRLKPRTEANCKVPRGADKTWPALDVDGMYRTPSVGDRLRRRSMGGYMRQGDRPLVVDARPSRRSCRAQRRRSRRLGREAARRKREVPASSPTNSATRAR